MGKINDLLQINDILDVYAKDIQHAISEECIKVAKEARQELKNNSPSSNTKHKGKYKNGWRVKVNTGFNYVDCVIFNSTSWQLTHLLEKPHLKRNGGLTTPKVHIKPIEEKYIKIYEKNVENIIKNGG